MVPPDHPGPISRYDQLAEQLYEPHSFQYERIKFGVQLMMWGWFKKLVIADRVGIFVDQVFSRYTEYTGFYAILGVIGYTIQIYGDFSGGMDIARGVSQIFGIDLTLNFKRPYFAASIPDSGGDGILLWVPGAGITFSILFLFQNSSVNLEKIPGNSLGKGLGN